MSGVSELKTRAMRLETEGALPEALQAFRDCVMQLEGTAAFLRELPLLVRVGDLEVRTGDHDAAVRTYERALGFYTKYGRAESVIATGLRIARIRPEAASFFDYALQLIGAGHPEAARRVLLEAARRSGHETEAAELDALEGAPEAEVRAAVERIVEEATAPDAQRRPMSLEDAIAEMRRRSGLSDRPAHPEPELPPTLPPPAVRRSRKRPLVWAVLAAGAALAAGGTWLMGSRTVTDLPPVVFEGPAPSPPDIAAAAQATVGAPAVETAPVEVEPAPPRPVAEAGPAPAAAPARLPAPAVTPPSSATSAAGDPGATSPDAAEQAPPPAWMRLPAGAVLTAPIVAIRELPVRRLDNAGRGFRLTQVLPGGDLVTMTLAPFPGSGVSEPRVTPIGSDSAMGSMRFQGFMVNARAPIRPDSLYVLLTRLVEVGPRQ